MADSGGLIMRLALDFPKTFEKARLSERQRQIVKYFRDGRPHFSQDIAETFDLTIQNATSQLRKLYDKDYLIRKELADETGGRIFEYRINPKIKSK